MRTLVVITLIGLAACAGDPPRAPVEDRRSQGTAARSWVPTTYSVSRGDTLYAIAWRYGLDYRQLARINGIASPYTIYPGQSLRLKGSPVPVARDDGKPAAAARATGKPAQSAPRVASKPAVTSRSPAPSGVTGSSINWRWPTRGKVVRRFSGAVHKGIDIDGEAGDPVLAVATGQVVYAGSGIVGYGKLLIIKHNDVYLSAYGHNRRLLVSEGAQVKAGQKIAEKGSSATNSVKLHFEIRREGKPVDPVKLLPLP
jgi:lipoprotein NlpD